MACENKYVTLLDLARQAKIITGNTACFDGKIETGIPFSGYPTGPDLTTLGSLGVVDSQSAVFSGNSGTTLFDVSNSASTNYDAIFSSYSATTWGDYTIFSANTSGLTLPITPLSADTQIVGPLLFIAETGMTGDHVIATLYTGYSITYSFFDVVGETATFPPFYSGITGFTTATQENFSAGTLDYKGPLDYISSVEDATVDGRLTTNKLTVTGGASLGTLGYVLTQTGNAGEVGWEYNSSSGGTFTGNTSATCITDIFVSNIHACSPLNINPLDEGNIYFGSTSGITVDITNTRVGVGTSNPSYPLEIFGPTNEKISFIDSSTAPQFNISGSPTQMIRLVATEGTSGIGIGVRGELEGTFPNYGEPGDTHIRGGENSHGLNIIEAPSATHDDYIRFYAGQSANQANTPDIHIQGVGATRGNVGINIKTPTEKLHISGGTIRIEDGTEQSGYVLTSNANGVATWQPSSGSSSGNLFSSTERSLNNSLLNFSGDTGGTVTYTIQNPYSDDPNSMLTGVTLSPNSGGTFTGKTYTLPSGTLDDGDILNFQLKFSRGILGDLLTVPVTDDEILLTSVSNTQLQIDGDFYDDNYLVNVNDDWDNDLDPIALTAGTVAGMGFMYRSDKPPSLTDAELTGTTLLNWDTLVNVDMVRIDATTLNITTNVDYKIHQPWTINASSAVRGFDFDAIHSSSNTNFTVNDMDSNSIVFDAAGWCLGGSVISTGTTTENIYCDYMIIDLNKKI